MPSKFGKRRPRISPTSSPTSIRFTNTSTDPFASVSRSVGFRHLLLVHSSHCARRRLGRCADGHHHLLQKLLLVIVSSRRPPFAFDNAGANLIAISRRH